MSTHREIHRKYLVDKESKWCLHTNNYCKYLLTRSETMSLNQQVLQMSLHQTFSWQGVKMTPSHKQLLQIFGWQGVKPCLYTNKYCKCWLDKELNNFFRPTTTCTCACTPKSMVDKEASGFVWLCNKRVGYKFFGEMPPSTGFPLKENRTQHGRSKEVDNLKASFLFGWRTRTTTTTKAPSTASLANPQPFLLLLSNGLDWRMETPCWEKLKFTT